MVFQLVSRKSREQQASLCTIMALVGLWWWPALSFVCGEKVLNEKLVLPTLLRTLSWMVWIWKQWKWPSKEKFWIVKTFTLTHNTHTHTHTHNSHHWNKNHTPHYWHKNHTTHTHTHHTTYTTDTKNYTQHYWHKKKHNTQSALFT